MATQPSLFPFCESHALPDGFSYFDEAISPDDEKHLLTRLAELQFTNFQFRGFEGRRRVVSFCWRYDFNSHKVLAAEPIPPFLFGTYRKVQASSGLFLRNLQQVLVTEYAPGAPIGWHRDRPVFDEIMGLSLASPCLFRLRKSLGNGKWERITIPLAPRSVYFLKGTVRREWEHSIPPVEAVRYSITFRNVLV